MTPMPAESRDLTPRIIIVEERVNAVGSKIVELEHDLFGNGQPGVIQRLETKMDRIEEKVGRLMVGVAVLAGGSGAAGTLILKSIFGG